MSTDVLIINALEDELKAVREVNTGAITESWEPVKDRAGLRYYIREFERVKGGILRVAAAWTLSQGDIAAAARAAGLVSELEPSCLTMSGVCAGRRSKAFLGDLIVANMVYKYDSGKIKAEYGSNGLRKEEILQELKSLLKYF